MSRPPADMAAAQSCLGSQLSALVDGELDHAARERVHGHLAHCGPCRIEVETLRRLKALLAASAGPPPGEDLIASLRALAVPGVDPRIPAATTHGRPVSPWGALPARRAQAPRPETLHRPARRRRHPGRRATAGGLALVGLGVALALGGQRPAPSTTTPVDPATSSFVSDYYSTTSEIPLTDSVTSASLVLPARGSRTR